MYSSKRSINNTACGNLGSMLRRSAAMLAVLIMTAATAWAGSKPVMNVDVRKGGPGYIHVEGWAYDPDNQDFSIDVLVYVYTETDLTQPLDTYVLNTYISRKDGDLGGITGNHGFESYIPIDAGNYLVAFQVFNKDLSESNAMGPFTVTVAAPQSGTVTLTPETGTVTLGNGTTLTGTGGAKTRVSIVPGATVTLSGVNITALPDDIDHMWAGISCLGDATIVLAQGTENTVWSGNSNFPGILVGPPGTTLTIRGSGSLRAQSGGNCWAAGIGSALYNPNYPPKCGNILIEDGNIEAYSFTAPAIGGSHLSSCGTITITGGNVYLESSGQGPGIGSTQSTCKGIIIAGGTVTAKSKRGPGLGSVTEGTCNYITITGGNVTAQTTDAASCIGSSLEGTCGTITIGGTVVDSVRVKSFVYNSQTTISYVHFNKNNAGATGTMVDEAFFSTAATQPLSTCAFSLKDYTFIGWNTAADGSGTSYSDGETITVSSDMTLYAQWLPTTFYVSFDKNDYDATGTMDNQVFTINTPQALTANTFTRMYYDFVGWNTESDGSGTSYADKETVTNLINVTLFAKWSLHNYNITYNLDGGTNACSNPATYTIESNAITLADPVRVGYVFAGWTFKGQDEPTMNVTIASGSHEDKTYTAHWTFTENATLTPETGDVVLYDGHTLTGTGGANTHVIIKDGATVTLSDVTINEITDDTYHMWAGITCEGNATIILANGTTNTLKGGYSDYSGITVPWGKTLTIQGSGTLYASSNGSSPGIGACRTDCGNIVIDGGTIFAMGGRGSAGIGTKYSLDCGNITITNGVTSVTATAGNGACSIGAGSRNGTVGTVTIGGIETGSILQSTFTYNPSDTAPYTVMFDANGGEGTMEPQNFVSNMPQNLTACSFTREGDEFIGWNTEIYGNGTSYVDKQNVINLGNVTLYAQWKYPSIVKLTPETREITLHDTQTLTGTGGTRTHITIADDATVTLNLVDLSSVTSQGAGIICAGNATIILSDSNTVKGGNSSPGIYVPEGHTLTIRGDGELTATGKSAAGIGGSDGTACGKIVIEGGTITATGGGPNAGIGSGKEASCGDIVITGGNINVTGTSSTCTGIGSGYYGSCGNITITGGNITVASGGNGGSGIGSGNYGSCGNITITGGTVNATSRAFSAGIGSGDRASCGDITITGGTVNATSRAFSAGIGSGNRASCGDITISNGITYVIATTQATSSNINIIGMSGSNSTCGTITIGDDLYDVTDGNTRKLYHSLTLAENADNSEAISNKKGQTMTVTLSGRVLYKDGAWNTLCLPFDMDDFDFTPLKGAIIKELDVTTSSLADGTLTLNFTDATVIEAGKPYIIRWDNTPAFTISTDADWETFASNVNDGTEDYADKIVKLAADINASAMVGTNEHPFRGMFDGDGHTLTLSISDTENQGTAPFRYISGATIMNVKTVGTVTGNLHCAGLVGFAKDGTNSINNCVVAADIVCSGGDHSHCGGILGHSLSSNTTISDCLFSGSISGATTATGIIHGWGDSGKHTIINCYANGIYSDGEPDLMKGGGNNMATNCYKNVETGTLGTYTTATGDDLVSLLGSGWKNDDGNVVPEKTYGILSPVIDPVFTDVMIDATASTTVAFTGGTFTGTYSPFASIAGLLFDTHNQNNGACHAVLSIDEPEYGELFFRGWYTDPKYNNPVTTIPFADDGSVTLFAKFTNGTAGVTFAKEGYSTYYNSLCDAVLPAGMKARIVTAKADGQALTYETIADGDLYDATTDVVPAGTAVMLQVAPANTSQSIDLTLTVPTAAAISQDNLLHGSDAAATTTGGDLFYKLSYNTSGQNIGWYWGAQDGGAFTSGAHKAWLALPSSAQHAALRSIGLPEFNESTTDVLLIPYPAQAEQPDVWYDMFGRKLEEEPTVEGIYIHNGQTIMIK